MLLFVDTALWEALVEQGAKEGRSPGDVLADALDDYIARARMADQR